MTLIGNISSDLVRAIQRTADEQQRAFQQLSSGRRIDNASDDPAAFTLATHTASQIADNDEYVTSTGTVQAMMQTADSTLNSVITSLTRAISLGVEGANGALSPAQRQAIAQEVLGIRDTVLSLANTSFNNTYLFAGTRSTSAPFVLDNAAVSSVRYIGSNEVNRVGIGESLDVQVAQTGAELFTDPSADVFGSLNDLYQAFVANDPTAVADATAQVRQAFDHVSTKRVFYGNNLQLLEQNSTFLNSNKVELSKQWDSYVAVDPTEAASRMLDAQQAHDRTLAAAAKVSSLSLLDLLK
jgi:flagellar hook-associated protein 3 FlgL